MGIRSWRTGVDYGLRYTTLREYHSLGQDIVVGGYWNRRGGVYPDREARYDYSNEEISGLFYVRRQPIESYDRRFRGRASDDQRQPSFGKVRARRHPSCPSWHSTDRG